MGLPLVSNNMILGIYVSLAILTIIRVTSVTAFLPKEKWWSKACLLHLGPPPCIEIYKNVLFCYLRLGGRVISSACIHSIRFDSFENLRARKRGRRMYVSLPFRAKTGDTYTAGPQRDQRDLPSFFQSQCRHPPRKNGRI